MRLTVDGHVSINQLDIDWQELPANANNAHQRLANIYIIKEFVQPKMSLNREFLI
jgi:hypothetical protein